MSAYPPPRVIVALDFPDPRPALRLAEHLDPRLCRVKVGKELFTRCGPRVIEGLTRLGYEVFLDLKFHDIPTTVAGACRAAADLGVWMVNVHTLGGRRMLEAAREAIPPASYQPLLVGVTLLTSLAAEDLHEIGIERAPEAQVLELAKLAQKTGLDGVVCSPVEITRLRAELDNAFCLVTPGVRPSAAAADDQRRVATPTQAIVQGADYLVIGRPITAAEDPRSALEAIVAEISRADA